MCNIVWHDSFTHETWLIHACDMTYPHVCDVQSRQATTHSNFLIHPYVWYDSVTRVTWPIRMCNMTHWRVWYDSFTFVTWLTHMCVTCKLKRWLPTQRCPSDSNLALPFWFQYFCARGKNLDLDSNAFWMFWIPISFKIQAGVFKSPGVRYLGEAWIRIYSCDWLSTICRCWADCIYVLFPLPACTGSHLWIHSVQSPSDYATRVRISNSQLWRFWRCWSRHNYMQH